MTWEGEGGRGTQWFLFGQMLPLKLQLVMNTYGLGSILNFASRKEERACCGKKSKTVARIEPETHDFIHHTCGPAKKKEAVCLGFPD